jgi:hypothetical protein
MWPKLTTWNFKYCTYLLATYNFFGKNVLKWSFLADKNFAAPLPPIDKNYLLT